jgi:hypothetical protein
MPMPTVPTVVQVCRFRQPAYMFRLPEKGIFADGTDEDMKRLPMTLNLIIPKTDGSHCSLINESFKLTQRYYQEILKASSRNNQFVVIVWSDETRPLFFSFLYTSRYNDIDSKK